MKFRRARNRLSHSTVPGVSDLKKGQTKTHLVYNMIYHARQCKSSFLFITEMQYYQEFSFSVKHTWGSTKRDQQTTMFLIFQWSNSMVQEGQSEKQHISSLSYLLKTEELFSPRIIKRYWRGHKHIQVLQSQQDLPLPQGEDDNILPAGLYCFSISHILCHHCLSTTWMPVSPYSLLVPQTGSSCLFTRASFPCLLAIPPIQNRFSSLWKKASVLSTKQLKKLMGWLK